MKLRNRVFFVFLVISITFLFSHPSINGQQQCQERQASVEIEKLIKIGPTVENHDVKKQKVAQKIHDDYLELCNLFIAGDYDGMADILGKNASIKTADGEYVRGQGNIKKYWMRMKEEENYDRVEFELVWAVIVHEERNPIFARDTDNMVYENFQFHLIKQSSGRIITNQDGDGERSGRHIHGCEWIGN